MKTIRIRCAWVALMVTVVAAGAGQARADTVLAKGPPALTQETVDKSIYVAEWALGVQFSTAQRQQWRAIQLEFWRKESLADMGGLLDVADLADRLQAMSPQERDSLLQKARPRVLEQIRANAPTAIDDKFLLDVYQAWNDRPVVPARNGVPALTPNMLKDYAAAMELAFDVHLDDAQRKSIQGHVIRNWQAGDKTNIDNALGWIARERELRAMGEGMRIGTGRFDIYPTVIAQARTEAATDAEVRELVAIHDEQHRPLAGGTNGEPPLQRRDAEAFLGVLFFIASKAEGLTGGQEIRPPQEVADAFVNALKENWKELPADNKTGLAPMVDLYPKMMVLWEKTEPDVQKSFIESIGDSPLGQEVRARVKELAAAQAAHEQELTRDRESTRAAAAARAQAAKSGQSVAQAAPAAPTVIGPSHPTPLGVSATPKATSSGGGNLSDFAKASHDLAMERMKTQMISNMMTSMHQNRMMVIYNTGGNGFEWKRR
jgi:hypothetical protein